MILFIIWFYDFISICTRENFSHAAQVFFPGILTLIIARYYRHVGVQFFDITFFFNIDTKLKQRISQNTEQIHLYCIQDHTCLKSFDYIILLVKQLRFCYANLIDTPEEDRQVLHFINPSVDSDGEDDDTFELERKFFWCF